MEKIFVLFSHFLFLFILLFFHCLHHNEVPNKYYCKVTYERAAQEELIKKKKENEVLFHAV